MTSIPAIQPVSSSDLKRMASGYGYRIDPFTKKRTMHWGMDFSAKTGTPIYATGDGRIAPEQMLELLVLVTMLELIMVLDM